MSKRKLSLRARLLALQLTVFGALLLLTSPMVYFLMSRTLHTDRDAYLITMARHLSEEFAFREETAPFASSLPPRCLPDPVPPDSSAPDATHRPRHLLVCDASLDVLCSDGEWAPLAPEAARRAFETDSPTFADVRWSAEILRLIAWPFKDRDGRTRVMEIGTSFMVIEGALKKGLIALVVIDLAAFLFLFAGSFLLTRGAFEPIDRIIRRVEQIDEDNLAERLPVEERKDEVGRLVTVINHMLERLEFAFEAQSRFSSDVAHEIRSPLTALRGQIEVALRKKRSTEEYVRVLEESLEEVLRLSRLAEDLMGLAKSDAGVLFIRRVELELGDVLHHILDRFKTRAGEKNIQLSLHAPEEATVLGDDYLLGRLVENLVENALIHTPHMGAIHVRLEKDEKQVSISVEDNGEGIPAEHLSGIFNRFYRVDPARSRDMGGTGLGLPIARQIALLHGGTIRVRSTLGEGSTFTVTIPRLNPPKADEPVT